MKPSYNEYTRFVVLWLEEKGYNSFFFFFSFSFQFTMFGIRSKHDDLNLVEASWSSELIKLLFQLRLLFNALLKPNSFCVEIWIDILFSHH